MAQVEVESATRERINQWLDRLIVAWRRLPQAEKEIDGWDLIERIDYIEEWNPKEALLDQLRGDAQAGLMDVGQTRRLAELEELVARYRPILTRLQQS